MSLLLGRCAAAAFSDLRARVPQRQPLPFLPLLKQVQGVSGSGFPVLSPSPGWGAKHTLREHEQLPPSLIIIAVGDSGQGTRQDLAPAVSGCNRDVTKCRCLGSLNGNQRRKLQGVRVHGLSWVNRSRPGCWPACGVHPVGLGHAQPANKAPCAVLRVQPSCGHIALQ